MILDNKLSVYKHKLFTSEIILSYIAGIHIGVGFKIYIILLFELYKMIWKLWGKKCPDLSVQRIIRLKVYHIFKLESY